MRYIIGLLGFFLILTSAKAQENLDLKDATVLDTEGVSDEFQELFFEALKQKGIENYDRAIIALDKCISIRPEEAALYFEKGKNLALLGKLIEAETNFNKALALKPNQKDIMESLFKVYESQQEYDKAITIVRELINIDVSYKEDLVTIYVKAKNYKEALSLINELDLKVGKNHQRDALHQEITEATGGSLELADIKKNNQSSTRSEDDYLKMIFAYTQQGNMQKAYETAQELLKINPDADAAHLALYKFNLEKDNPQEALVSIQKVLKSDQIEAKTKQAVLNDFLHFVENNPENEADFENMLQLFSDREKIDLNPALGAYYYKKQDYPKALHYYQEAYQNDVSDVDVMKNLAFLYLGMDNFEGAITISEDGIMFYPSQPVFYLFQGMAYNNLNQYKKAIQMLEMGLDYLIDNTKIAIEFYEQLAFSYEKTGNVVEAKKYREKINTIN